MQTFSLSVLIAGLSLTANTQKAGAEKILPASAVLEGVPRIGFDLYQCPFPGCLTSCLEYMGDKHSYEYLMAVSGGAFRRLWKSDDPGNMDLMYFAPEACERVFRALGYEYQTVSSASKSQMIDAIRNSINAGRPALAFGVMGPPECGIITGYEDDGETLRGYSFFQDPSISGYYRQNGWYEKSGWRWKDSLIVIGRKKESRPSARETLLSTLKWAIHLARAPEWMEHANGLAAYDAWAKGLELDLGRVQDTTKEVEMRCVVQADQCMMTEDRRAAGKFLREMAGQVQEASGELNAAAEGYLSVAEMNRKLWPWKATDHQDPEVREGLSNPGASHELAEAVWEAKKIEETAVGHLEKAVSIMEKTNK